MGKRIYFDNGSTSWPKAPKVAEAMAGLLEQGAYNINRGNYEGASEVEGLVLETRMHPAALKDAVCSPAGSTIEGVHALEEGGFRAAAENAVLAAYRRSLELGK